MAITYSRVCINRVRLPILLVISFSFLFFFFHLTYCRWASTLLSCLWSLRIFPSLPGSEQRNLYFSVRSRLGIWSRETGLAIPSRVSLFISILGLNLVLTCGIPPDFRGGVHLFSQTAIRQRVRPALMHEAGLESFPTSSQLYTTHLIVSKIVHSPTAPIMATSTLDFRLHTKILVRMAQHVASGTFNML